MVNAGLLTPTLLKENILFLIIGTFASSLAILFFDTRLYTAKDVFLLFVILFLSLLIQSFAGSLRIFITRNQASLFYAKSLLINYAFLSLFYAWLLPFSFDAVVTLKLCILVTSIATSLFFFIRYKKQYTLNLEKEKLIEQTVKQQQVKELEVLKQQIDPHFIFNSFNTLAFLIDQNSDKAKQFSNKLANVHRYILFNGSKNLVSLADELGFAKDYAYLQEIRHSNEVQIHFTGFADVDHVFILPVSIQVLIENAIKHNAFSETVPLLIHVCHENQAVSVENNLITKNYDSPSSKIGLTNLRDRCRLILGKDLQILKSDRHYKAFVPLLYK
ncbi:MAG: hypothetical protein EON98_07525 [Chitinophagaceae bacterium]|nr:MAG: hypothetical protein EON98_07525 [Chitinophagaceae bacterium]